MISESNFVCRNPYEKGYHGKDFGGGLDCAMREDYSNTITSWEPEATGSVIYGGCCCNYVHQFSFISWSHDNHVGQASHICDIECSAVGRSICPN